MVDLPVWPVFSDEEISAVRTVLESGRVNYWTGDECKKFEHEFASYVGTRHAVALANGSVALDLALRAIGIKAGDEVIVTPPLSMHPQPASCAPERNPFLLMSMQAVRTSRRQVSRQSYPQRLAQ